MTSLEDILKTIESFIAHTIRCQNTLMSGKSTYSWLTVANSYHRYIGSHIIVVNGTKCSHLVILFLKTLCMPTETVKQNLHGPRKFKPLISVFLNSL